MQGEVWRVVGEIKKPRLLRGGAGVREKIQVAMSQFQAFIIESQAVRRGGSAALDLCYTALGRCDGFWELDLHPWDTAAGLIILEEAGGKVTDFAGNPFSVYDRQIVASNGRIHDEMLKITGAFLQSRAGMN